MTAEPDEGAAAAEVKGEAGGEGAPERGARQARAGAFLGVPIEVTISVGKARPLVSEQSFAATRC